MGAPRGDAFLFAPLGAGRGMCFVIPGNPITLRVGGTATLRKVFAPPTVTPNQHASPS